MKIFFELQKKISLKQGFISKAHKRNNFVRNLFPSVDCERKVNKNKIHEIFTF